MLNTDEFKRYGGGCENFVGERDEFVFDAFSDSETVERA